MFRPEVLQHLYHRDKVSFTSVNGILEAQMCLVVSCVSVLPLVSLRTPQPEWLGLRIVGSLLENHGKDLDLDPKFDFDAHTCRTVMDLVAIAAVIQEWCSYGAEDSVSVP